MIYKEPSMTSGNLIVQGMEFRFEALVCPHQCAEGIGFGKVVKLDVFNRDGDCILAFDYGNWVQKADNDPVKEEIVKLIQAEFGRDRS